MSNKNKTLKPLRKGERFCFPCGNWMEIQAVDFNDKGKIDYLRVETSTGFKNDDGNTVISFLGESLPYLQKLVRRALVRRALVRKTKRTK